MFVVLGYPLVVLVCPLVVLECPLVVLDCPLVVSFLVLSVDLFITDPKKTVNFYFNVILIFIFHGQVFSMA